MERKPKKKTDLRVLRTKKMIFQAFIKLVQQKDIDRITIQDIADEAMINRATFYLHFKDKNDLFDQIFLFAMDAFSGVLDPAIVEGGNRLKVRRLEKVITQVFKEIKKNQQFYIVLTESSYMKSMREKVQELITEKYNFVFSQLKVTENDLEVPIDFIIEYMSSIFISTVHWWLNTNSDFPPEQMAHLLIKLVGNGHLTVLGIEVDYENK